MTDTKLPLWMGTPALSLGNANALGKSRFLRAFHDFEPSQSSDSSTSATTAALREGDLIFVHSVHANGWADGTILRSGDRGWIPTNYCQLYHHAYIRNLLNAFTQLRDAIGSDDVGLAWTNGRQDHVQALIAGVRYLLEKTDCLHREDSLVKRHIGLRHTRKGILSDLAAIIRQQDQIRDILEMDIDEVQLIHAIEEHVQRVSRVMTRAVRFLDIWMQSVSEVTDQPLSMQISSLNSPAVGITSPSRESKCLSKVGSEEPHPTWAVRSQHGPANASTLKWRRQRNGEDVLGSNDDHKLARPTSHTLADYEERHMPASSARLQPSVSNVPHSKRSSLASKRIKVAHNTFLACIGSFIGLHMQPRSSTDLAAITKCSVETCDALLAIIELILVYSSDDAVNLEQTIFATREKSTKLLQTAEDIFSDGDDGGEHNAIESRSSQVLVTAATACVRAAGQCVARAQESIAQYGDFVIKTEDDAAFDVAHLSLGNIFAHASNATGAPVETQFEAGSDDQQTPVPDVQKSTRATPVSSPIRTTRTSGGTEADTLVPGPGTPLLPHCRTGATSLKPSTEAKEISLTCQTPLTAHLETPVRKSVVLSGAESTSTYRDSITNSVGSEVVSVSTRATTPDNALRRSRTDAALLTSFASGKSVRSVATDCSDSEAEILEKSYAHELLYNKDGQILGGTLVALVEELTSQHSAPGLTLLATFLLTFRLFTDAIELTQTLIDRYDYAGEEHTMTTPTRLRIYNFFKGWLESYWSATADVPALVLIRSFAVDRLGIHYRSAGQKLAALVDALSTRPPDNAASQLVSLVGKTSVSLVTQYQKDVQIPQPVVSKTQLSLLRSVANGSAGCNVMEFEELELARQLTLMESAIFCEIQPEELLALEWTKQSNKASHVRAMSRFSTDLANLVAHTILQAEEVKKRAAILKQWIKIAKCCLELDNYDSVMAIVCSLTSSTISRLRRTWEATSQRAKTQLEDLKSIVDVSRNYATLRQRLQSSKVPCLPFVGIYLTDLTFLDAGNQDTRLLPSSSAGGEQVRVINFDKHMRTAKVISQLQKFQVRFRLQAVPELQDWLKAELGRMGMTEAHCVQAFYKRSLQLEPRLDSSQKDGQAKAGAQQTMPFWASKRMHKADAAGRAKGGPLGSAASTS